MNRYWAWLVFCLLISSGVYGGSGWVVEGRVLDSLNGTPVVGASVSLWIKEGEDRRIAATRTDESGFFQLRVLGFGTVCLRVSALGYAEVNRTLDAQPGHPTTRFKMSEIQLRQAGNLLDTVIVSGYRRSVGSDTLVFDVLTLSSGGEQVLGDLLKNIPGVTVGRDGSVRVGQQEVDRIVVDGADLFGKGYTFLTQSMPVYPLKQVEVLRRYEPNELMKGLRYSEAVALNLVLEDEFRGKWFGSVAAGWAPASRERYEGKADIMNFAKSAKYYLSQQLNSLGYEPLEALADRFEIAGEGILGEEVSSPRFTEVARVADPEIPMDRFRFNQSSLSALSGIVQPTLPLEIKFHAMVDGDKALHKEHSIERLFLGDDVLERTSQTHAVTRIRTLVAGVDFKWMQGTSRRWKIGTRLRKGMERDGRHPRSMDANSETLLTNEVKADQFLEYQFRMTPRMLLDFQARLIYSNSTQNYHLQGFEWPFEPTFSMLADSLGFLQRLSHGFRYSGVEGRLFRRTRSGFLEAKIGMNARRDELEHATTPSAEVIAKNHLLVNGGDFSSQDGYARVHYRVLLGTRWRITARGGIQSIERLLRASDKTQQRTIWSGIERGIKIEWNQERIGCLLVSFSRSGVGFELGDIYQHPLIRDRYSLVQGSSSPVITELSTTVFQHEWGDVGSDFLWTTTVYLLHYPRYMTENFRAASTWMIVENTPGINRILGSFTSTLDCFLEDISSTLKLTLSRDFSQDSIRLDGQLIQSSSSRSRVEISLRSGFRRGFNFHVGAGGEVHQNRKNQLSKSRVFDRKVFADLRYYPRGNWQFNLKSEWYFWTLPGESARLFGLVDFETGYDPEESKWGFFLSGKNLLDIRQHRREVLTELGNLVFDQPMLPRYFLLSARFRF